jgi:hypothetical protein
MLALRQACPERSGAKSKGSGQAPAGIQENKTSELRASFNRMRGSRVVR